MIGWNGKLSSRRLKRTKGFISDERQKKKKKKNIEHKMIRTCGKNSQSDFLTEQSIRLLVTRRKDEEAD